MTLLGTDSKETVLVREAYDIPAALSKNSFEAKAVRSYQLDSKEGIYEAVPAGASVAYTSRSGKVFVAREQEISREIYPARVLEKVMYPIFIAAESADEVWIGEQESGDILELSVADGSTRVLKTGTEPFSGGSSYAPVNLLRMSMQSLQSFAGVVKNSGSGYYELLLANGSDISVVEQIRSGVVGRAMEFLLAGLGWFVILLLACQLVRGFVYMVRSGRTILSKLTFATLPLLVLVLVLFGVFSYKVYDQSISQSFQKQVVDEGNMLTALFGTDSFNEIEYPYHYTGEAYSYLMNQMNTRELYTRTAYYERSQLFTGVDRGAPCFYPFEIKLNKNAAELYRQAAYTGVAQTGVIDDADGKRIVCITPIGGVSGGTVYLLETGILTANMARYTTAYLRSYVLVALCFILAVGLILTGIFRRILQPIGAIKEGLEAFSKGNHAIRLENSTSDEFSDITRVFNKMANDIDTQLYDLKKVSETYFRFIPQKEFQLLGKENLGDLTLGSSIQKEYHILCVSLSLRTEQPELSQELTNRCFNILNTVCEENGGTLTTDSVNLRRLRVICPDGDHGVAIALSTLSRIDGLNATLPVQNRVDLSFVVHRCPIYYGICGDEKRFIPAMLSSELDFIAEHEKQFWQLSSRLIVTEAAFAGLDKERYFHRFIGYPEDVSEGRFGLYDFYDGSSAEETRLIGETQSTFEKAMSLYLEKRYYDAKNLFAMVLRSNQYDNVARYYIFNCEKHI